mgnify:CR=1 FL=1
MLAVSSTLMAQEEAVVDVLDSVGTANEGDSLSLSKREKKPSWFKRAYLFADRVLSPPRDTNYVDTQDNYNWCAEVQLSARFEQFQLDAGNDFNIRVTPKWRTRIGPFFGWRFAFLGYNIDLKSVFMNGDDTDLSASVYSAAFGLDLFYRRVGGNYNIRNLTIKGTDYSGLLQDQPFDGIKVGMTRVSFYYVTNYKHFSHQAAYSQSNRQLRSAGSPILGISYAHNRMSVDWKKLANMVNEINNTDYDTNALYGKQINDEFSFTGGYGYNWVFAKNWLAGAELTGSLGYLLQHTATGTKDEDKEDEQSNFIKKFENFGKKNIAFNGTLRMVVLYNNGPWFFGTQGYVFYYQYGNGLMMTRNMLGLLYLYVGFNF